MGDTISYAEAKARLRREGAEPSEPEASYTFTCDFYDGPGTALLMDVTSFAASVDQNPAERLRLWADLLIKAAACCRTDAADLDEGDEPARVVGVAFLHIDGSVRLRSMDDDLRELDDADVDALGRNVAAILKDILHGLER